MIHPALWMNSCKIVLFLGLVFEKCTYLTIVCVISWDYFYSKPPLLLTCWRIPIISFYLLRPDTFLGTPALYLSFFGFFQRHHNPMRSDFRCHIMFRWIVVEMCLLSFTADKKKCCECTFLIYINAVELFAYLLILLLIRRSWSRVFKRLADNSLEGQHSSFPENPKRLDC